MTKHPLFDDTRKVAVAAMFLLASLYAALPASAERATGRAAFDRMIEIEPAAGRDTVGAIAIDWCDGVTVEHPSGGALARRLSQMKERGYSWNGVIEVATYLCGAPTDPDYKRQAGYFIQGLVNLAGQSKDTVVRDLRSRVDARNWDSARKKTCARFDVSDEASTEKRELAAAHREVYACGRDAVPAWWEDRASMDIGYHLDRLTTSPSQVLRAHHVARCLSTARGDAAKVVAYASCSGDIAALNPATLTAELKKARANHYETATAHQHLARVLDRAKTLEREVFELAANNSAYKTFAIEVPRKAQATWSKTRNANADALAAAAAYEVRFLGPSRKAARGCADSLRPLLRRYVAKGGARTLDAAKARATDAVGSQLLSRLAACEAVEGNAHAAAMLYSLAKDARQSRGERAAVRNALIDALSDIRDDRPRFPIKPTMLPREGKSELLDGAYRLAAKGVTAMQKGAGRVKSTNKVDGGVVVTFKTESWIEDNWHCRDTRKVWKVEASGRVIYHKSCKKVGKRKVSRTPKPIWVDGAYASGIKKGAFLEFDYDVRKRGGAAMSSVRTVYRSKKRNKLVAAFGIKL